MKIKASTLLESIVALVIISVAFGISLITYVSVIQSGNLNRKVVVHEKLQSIAAETKVKKAYFNDYVIKDGIEYSKTIDKINGRGLIKLNIKAVGADSSFIENYSELIITDAKN